MDIRFIYIVAVLISLLELVVFYETNGRRTNKNFITLFFATLISNFGYAVCVHSPKLMDVYKSSGGYGYIAFDSKKRFLGCDELLRLILF